MTTPPEFELRARQAADEAFFPELFAATRRELFAALALPEAAMNGLLAMQARAQAMSYAAQFPASVDQVVWVQGHRAGRVLVERTTDEIHLIDIALLPAYQGQGIGLAIVSGLVAEAREAGALLSLTVREDNPARRLYLRIGLLVAQSDGMNARMVLPPAPR